MGRYLLLLSAVVFLVWTCATSLTRVQPGERAVIRRFGRILDTKPDQGLYIGWPWGVERVDLVRVGKDRQVNVGFMNTEEKDAEVVPIGQMLTGDHNLVNVQAEVKYKVREAEVEKFLLHEDRIDALIARSAESFFAEWIAARRVDDVLVRGKAVLPGIVRDRLQDRLAEYDLGVDIEQVNITSLFPPEQVKDVFKQLQEAETGIGTRVNQAEQEAANNKGRAKAKQFSMIRSANAYAGEELVKANAEAASFRRRLEQYRTLSRTDPDYLNAIWLDDMTRLYALMRQTGRIDLLDHYLTKEGITITQFPLLPKKR